MGGRKERSRERRKKKQQETDIGVNPVWEELWFQFIFPLEMLSSSLLLVWGLAYPGEWMAWEREMRWRINSLQWKFLDHQSTLHKTSYACSGHSGISPVGRLSWLLIWTRNSDSIDIKTALRGREKLGTWEWEHSRSYLFIHIAKTAIGSLTKLSRLLKMLHDKMWPICQSLCTSPHFFLT